MAGLVQISSLAAIDNEMYKDLRQESYHGYTHPIILLTGYIGIVLIVGLAVVAIFSS